MFRLFSLNVDYFDVEKYGGVSNTDPSWRGRYQGALVLMPHADRIVDQLDAVDVLVHYFDNDFNTVLADSRGQSSESAVVLADLDAAHLAGVFAGRLFDAVRPHRFVGAEFSGKHLIGTPDLVDAQKASAKIRARLEEEDKAHHYRVSSIELRIEKTGMAKTLYGACEVQRFPLHKAARLFLIPRHAEAVGTIELSKFDPLTDPDIPVTHAFFTVVCAVFASLSFRRRVQMEPPAVRFTLPNGSLLEWGEFAAVVCLAELDRVWRFSDEVNHMLLAYAAAIHGATGLSDELRARFVSVLLVLESRVRFNDPRPKKAALKDAIEAVKASKQVMQLAKQWSAEDTYDLANVSTLIAPLATSDTKTLDSREMLVSHGARGATEEWQSDASHDKCVLCTKSFNLVRYRHHCRRCGKVVCDACSQSRQVIATMGKKPRRVCDACVKAGEAQPATDDGSAPPLFSV